MGLGPHTRLSRDAEVCLLEEAAQGSYEKAGRLSGGEGSVNRETVMRHAHGINLSPYRKEGTEEKYRVKYLYLEADEDHIALQFYKKKGDIICGGTPGTCKPPDRDEGILPGSNKQDMRMRLKNGKRGKSAHVNPQVKLHYRVSTND